MRKLLPASESLAMRALQNNPGFVMWPLEHPDVVYEVPEMDSAPIYHLGHPTPYDGSEAAFGNAPLSQYCVHVSTQGVHFRLR